jgi:hypothetical protein
MMAEPQQIPTGVVIDEPMGRALLYAAAHEGLVDSDPTIGDGFVGKLTSQPPSEHMLVEAFEQLVLGGKVFVPSSWHPVDWKGQIFEEGIVDLIELSPTEKLTEFSEISPDVALGMLSARGIHWSENEYEARLQAYLNAVSEWEAVADGKTLGSLEVLMSLSNIIPIPPDEYSPKQIDKFRAVKKEESLIKNFFECVEAYQRVITASLNLGALSSLPLHTSSLKAVPIAKARDSAETRRLFRIVCKQLHRVPVGETLDETVKLATSPGAKALRRKLAEWTEKLRHGEIEAATLVLNEFEKARSSLMGAKRLARTGNILTFLGVPLGIATDLLSGFITAGVGTAIGLSVSGAGTMALAKQLQIEHSNQWAMYGQILS